MKWSKKFWRVQFKLAKRNFKNYPHYALVTIMFAVTASIGTLAIIDFKQNYQHKNFSTFTLWQSAQSQIADRVPAGISQSDFTCSYGQVSLEQIQHEVKELEQKYQTGSIIEGKFYGLDLKLLPSIGAQLLADNKTLIGDKNSNQDFSKCLNVPCVFNKVYQDPTGLSGYFAYYWYLKTGSMISMTNFVPNQHSIEVGHYNGKKHNFNDFLFSQLELRNFYFLAKSLPEKLTFIPLFKSIHKIPEAAQIEGQRKDVCSMSLPNGQILLAQDCLKGSLKDFFINTSKEIAKYADRHEGLKLGLTRLSDSKDWLLQSSWFKESYFNPSSHKFEYKWMSNLPKEHFIGSVDKRSPSEQLATLIAHYRFDSEHFKSKIPMDTRSWIQENFFGQTSYDSEGLYKQYIQESLDVWARQEVSLWRSCLETHLADKDVSELQRDIASSLDHPLYTCVESKILGFVNFIERKVEKEYFEGCQFFNDSVKFGHMKSRFEANVQKYLMEKILQRKIEIQKHGPEVLTAQEVKDEFIQTVDPKEIYVLCYDHQDPKFCYESKMKSKLTAVLNKFNKFSDYYKKIVQEDIIGLYPFSHVKEKSNEAAKLFLAPYSARLHQAANKMWNSCKDRGMDHSVDLKLPMKFSGGRYFVNPKLINCINENVEEELFNLAKMKAFHSVSGERQVFTLNKDEQKFALSFLEGMLLQTLNNILDQEYVAEKVRFDLHFKKAEISAMTDFSDDKSLIEDIFSLRQVGNICMKKVVNYYPENYFYHSKPAVDKTFGQHICERFVSLPKIKEKLNEQVAMQWQRNKEMAINYLAEHYQGLVDDCYSDYPVTKRGRNQRYRNICIQQSFEEASFLAIKDWRGHKHYKYFGDREDEIVEHFNSLLRDQFISRANQQQPLLRQPASDK